MMSGAVLQCESFFFFVVVLLVGDSSLVELGTPSED